MPLQQSPLALTKEGILGFGAFGSGKSHAWATIRKWYEMTETPGRFYIISTEWEMAHRVAEGYLDGGPGNNFFSNAEIHEAHDFASLYDIAVKIRQQADEHSWVIVDSIGNAWNWVQDEHTIQLYGKSASEYRAEGGKKFDWQRVNERYRSFLLPNILRWPGHRYLCAQADKVSTEGDWADPLEVQRKYRPFGGYKPVGQKELAYQLHSILYFSKAGKDDYRLSSVDDPSRVKLEDAKVEDFVTSYLLGPAGWVLT